MSTFWAGLGNIVGPIIGFLLGLIPHSDPRVWAPDRRTAGGHLGT